MDKLVEEYGINYLVHFTKADNLESIFKNGLLPIKELQNKGINYNGNDEYRFDGCEDATSVSIQFPNYRMFYKYREQNREVDWVVLGLRKEILWQKKCAFCVENAASSNISSSSIAQRLGIEAFKKMYEEYPGKPSRQQLAIDKSLPTNPQAEVLVFDKIETSYIWGVAFLNQNLLNKYSNLIPVGVKSSIVPDLFSYRADYEWWR
ncbi:MULTISPECIES: DarT ssDNA thymidine ADP-ribosyltransferase family protein [Bacillaceae]|uniref:DarT ssDNA thymidine ADP-ribosyltransferase family protein n=1 Tax=Bacillaceae TaxID=186817 RepID=UPI00296554F4|nr:DarT ssDNA thymidine ADP-ribosyltransferase family protein [Bacillus infantis]MDW2878161.1 DarT ssDNA thymidine ADP-ribosyltransferase family protein [Bacillus infantis]